MDVPDVDLVIVYGIPKNMSQLYQVIKSIIDLITLYYVVCVLVQLFGRAGRGGGTSRAHLFYSSQQKNVDKEIGEYCKNTQNCLRKSLLKAIGDTAPIESSSTACCSNCPPSQFSLPPKLGIIESNSLVLSKKKRRAHWKVTEVLEDTLKNRLIQERKKYVQDHPVFIMIGEKAVCPNCVIDAICKEARFVQSKEDILAILGLRPELQDVFVNVILDVLSDSPVSVKRRRRN